MLKVKFKLADLTLKAEVNPRIMEGDAVIIDFTSPEDAPNLIRIFFQKIGNEWIAQNGVNRFGTYIQEQVNGKKLEVAVCDLDLLAAAEVKDQEHESKLSESAALLEEANTYNHRWRQLLQKLERTPENMPSEMDYKILEFIEYIFQESK